MEGFWHNASPRHPEGHSRRVFVNRDDNGVEVESLSIEMVRNGTLVIDGSITMDYELAPSLERWLHECVLHFKRGE